MNADERLALAGCLLAAIGAAWLLVDRVRAASRRIDAHVAAVTAVEWDAETFLALTTEPGWLDTLADIDALAEVQA